MYKKFLIAIAGFIVVVAVLTAVKAAQIEKVSSVSHVPAATAVTTIEAKSEAWQPVIDAIGTLAPVQGVTVSADADGKVSNIAVENGAAVRAGDLIIELDTSVEVAQLAAAKARADLAKLQYDRASELLAKNTSSKAEADSAIAQLDQARADVVGLQATIDRKRVRAPFDGRVGIRMVNLGQFVARGKPMVAIQKLDPIYVNFNVPQRQLGALAIGQKIEAVVDAFPTPFEGKIAAINSEVDPSTRNVEVQALVANPKEQLRSGMFVQVEVQLPATAAQIVLPATAISYASYGNSVFIVEQIKDKDGKEYLGVRQQFVKLGDTRGDLVSVADGVKAGEKVVTSGVFKLRNGTAVQINNSSMPGSDSAPKPSNS